jgi:hypothetical protein
MNSSPNLPCLTRFGHNSLQLLLWPRQPYKPSPQVNNRPAFVTATTCLAVVETLESQFKVYSAMYRECLAQENITMPPHTTHHVPILPTSSAKSSAKKATGQKEFKVLRLLPLDPVPHLHSVQLFPVAWIHHKCGHVPIDLDHSYPTSKALRISSIL